MSERPEIHVDSALDHPTGIERAIRFAAANVIVVLGTEAFFSGTDADCVEDMDRAKRLGQRVIVLLERGVIPPAGFLPDSAEIHEVAIKGTDMSEVHAVLKRALGLE